MRLLLGIFCVLLLGMERPGWTSEPQSQRSSPLSPAEAVKTFRLADDDLVIELVAAEPDVSSPVAIAWDEDGRLFVAEMRDYPQGPPTGRIKCLANPDDRGRYRQVSVFADQLPFPTGVLPWEGGILVTAAPHIWYFRDADGDGRADQQRIVLTGFGEGNPQLRVNGLLWGLDNWIYGANGRSGGAVRRPEDPPSRAIPLEHRDFRFQPDRGVVEAVAGFSQFGLARDDWGRRFLSWNTEPFRYVVLEERYLNRNRYLAATETVASIADPADPNRVWPISPPPITFNREPVQVFNASCGNTIYRDDALGSKYSNSLFVCEPLTNLVQHRYLVPTGVAFTARRSEAGREFLASTDPWFHPVYLTTGPDGALYVVDFYRQWVEHPQFVPEKLRQGIEWRKGAECGRIWRIRRKDASPSLPALRVKKESGRIATADLVRCLDHVNGWQRDTAQRLLVERQDRQAVPLLQQMVRHGRLPQARLHALWTLEGLKSLDEESLLHALRDPCPILREHAVRLSEGRLASTAKLQKEVFSLAQDADMRVRLQCAATLGELSGSPKRKTLAAILHRDATNKWIQLAVLSSLQEGEAWPFLRHLVEQEENWRHSISEAQILFLKQLAALVAARRHPDELAEALRMAAGASLPEHLDSSILAVLAGLTEGLKRSGQPLRTLMASPPPQLHKALCALDPLWPALRCLAIQERASLHRRAFALQVLSDVKPDLLAALVPKLLHPEQPHAVQQVVAGLLGEIAEAPSFPREVWGYILEHWGKYTLPLRGTIIASLLRSPKAANLLVEALEQKKLLPADLDPAAQETLRRFPNRDLQKRARALLDNRATADRSAVLRKYEAALRLVGDRRRGAQILAANCLSCHQFQGQGHNVGPNLSSVADRAKAALLVDILDPNREVNPDFRSYVLTTTSGRVLTGLLADETSAAVKLRRADGVEDTVLRSEIEELRPTGRSLMPEGLEQNLSLQDLADLLAFLKQPTPLPKPK